jgi:hypothetical protein
MRAKADPQFGQSTDPSGFAGHIVNFTPFAGSKRFEGQDGNHGRWQLVVIEIQSL